MKKKFQISIVLAVAITPVLFGVTPVQANHLTTPEVRCAHLYDSNLTPDAQSGRYRDCLSNMQWLYEYCHRPERVDEESCVQWPTVDPAGQTNSNESTPTPTPTATVTPTPTPSSEATATPEQNTSNNGVVSNPTATPTPTATSQTQSQPTSTATPTAKPAEKKNQSNTVGDNLLGETTPNSDATVTPDATDASAAQGTDSAKTSNTGMSTYSAYGIGLIFMSALFAGVIASVRNKKQ